MVTAGSDIARTSARPYPHRVTGSNLRWSTFDRVVVTQPAARLSPADLDALANVLTSVAARVGRRLLLLQISSSSDGVSVHRVGKDASSVFARYAAAVRAHVEEVHGVLPGSGPVLGAFRGLVSVVTKFGPNPSILHPSVDAAIEALRAKHGIDPAALRASIARV